LKFEIILKLNNIFKKIKKILKIKKYGKKYYKKNIGTFNFSMKKLRNNFKRRFKK